jgi:hypothetical protein
MANRLRVTELDFDTIKLNLKNFLKQQSEFTDYDFEGSGLNILLDVLAYNTHYNAYYLNMVANEAFLDTALLRDSVVSHAKTLGYTPYSKHSPVATINFTVNSSTATTTKLTIPKGFTFLSNQIDGKPYKFVVLDDVTATKANSKYYFENLQIYEGQLINYNFVYDESTNPKQLFTIPENNIDTETISVSVAQSSSNTQLIVYNKVNDILDVVADDEVYFIQENRNGNYEIYFGNDSVGKKLPDGAVVYTSYLVTNATQANKANNFVATQSLIDNLGETLTNFTITPISAASGGSDRESVDEIKFNSISQYSTQNRLVTVKDYESYIKKSYPALDSISVWGGEDEIPKVFGKVLISLKPKDGYFISEYEKQRIIREIVNPKSIVSITPEIRDPEYLYVLVTTNVKYDKKKTLLTSENLKNSIRNSILIYRNTYLNKFNSVLTSSRLQDAIDLSDASITGNEMSLKLKKKFTPILSQPSNYLIKFNTLLKRGTSLDRLTSTEFSVYDDSGVLRNVIIEEVPESFTGISEIIVTNPGYNYVSTPSVVITGDGSGAQAIATVVNGRIESIKITNRGINYSRALLEIVGGGGIGGAGIVNSDSKIGTLRLVYFDERSERQIVRSEIGTINYETGEVYLNNLRVISSKKSDGFIDLSIRSELGIIKSTRNTILSIDESDSTSIVIQLEAE